MKVRAPNFAVLEALSKLQCGVESVRGGELLEWLAQQQAFPRFYWRSQDGDFEVAACGAAYSLTPENAASAAEALDLLSQFFSTHPLRESLVAVGGSSFWPEINPSEQWGSFAQFDFVLPKLTLIREKSSLRLVRIEAQPSEFISDFITAGSNSFPPSGLTEQPKFREWCDAISVALSEIRNGKIEKVVLARKTTIALNVQIESAAILRMLREAQQFGAPFLFEPDLLHSFMGVSPERLFLLKNDLLSAEAVGGTAAIAGMEDRSSELLNDSKNREEHALVVTHLRTVLGKFVSKLNFDRIPSIRKLKDLMHLRSDVSGSVKKDLSLGALFKALHPTPAVCGTPTAQALQLIAELEGFARGWYAGPIGVVSANRTEFNVAIRSMLLSAGRAEIFAGAGIVGGSVAQDEWEELNRKAALPLKLLNNLERAATPHAAALAV